MMMVVIPLYGKGKCIEIQIVVFRIQVLTSLQKMLWKFNTIIVLIMHPKYHAIL